MIDLFKKNKNFFVFIFLFIVIFTFAGNFLNSYFQQDEWHGFGLVIANNNLPLSSWFSLVSGQHYFPFNLIFWAILFNFFGFNAAYYALTSLILHLISSFLVYLFMKKISKNFYVGFLSSILFAMNARADQGFLHLAVFPSTVTSFIFIIAILLYLLLISKKKRYEIKDFLIISFYFLITVHFREDGLFLIPLIPIFILLFARKTINKRNLKFFLGIFLTAVAFLGFRVVLQFLDANSTSQTNPKILQINYYKILITNVLTFPFKVLIENLVEPFETLYKFSHYFYFLAKVDTIFLLNIMFMILGSLTTISLLLSRLLIKNLNFYKFAIFSLIGIFLYALLLSTVGRTMDIVEPRYLYFTGFLVMSTLAWFLVELFNTKFKYGNYIKNALIIVFVFLYLVYSFNNTQLRLNTLNKVSEIRKSIITQVLDDKPSIKEKTIFYFQCKGICLRNSEFGISNNLVLPFSSGPGWILMLQYAKNNQQVYAPFFRTYNKDEVLWDWRNNRFDNEVANEFLWDMGAQGYNEINGRGFGYFTNLDLLKKTIKNYNLSKDSVVGFEYDEKNIKITDKTKEIIKQL